PPAGGPPAGCGPAAGCGRRGPGSRQVELPLPGTRHERAPLRRGEDQGGALRAAAVAHRDEALHEGDLDIAQAAAAGLPLCVAEVQVRLVPARERALLGGALGHVRAPPDVVVRGQPSERSGRSTGHERSTFARGCSPGVRWRGARCPPATWRRTGSRRRRRARRAPAGRTVDDGTGRPAGVVGLTDAEASGSPGRGFPARSGDDRFIIYTGGTTGMPKGVVLRR